MDLIKMYISEVKSSINLMLFDYFFLFLFFLCFFFWFLLYYFFKKRISNESRKKFFTNEIWIEVLIVLVAVLFIACLLFPSLGFLYFSSFLNRGSVFLEIIGSQWKWSYSYVFDYWKEKSSNYDFGRFSGQPSLLSRNWLIGIRIRVERWFFRNLETARVERWFFRNFETTIGLDEIFNNNSQIIVPTKTSIVFCMTSIDVIHSFSLLGLGIKYDVLPGIYIFDTVLIFYETFFFGSCSEFCGLFHSIMPIIVRSISTSLFFSFFSDKNITLI